MELLKQMQMSEQHEGKSDEDLKVLVEEEMHAKIREREAMLEMPGVVPFSDEYLGIMDADQNMLYTIVCMKDQVNDYVRILKKNNYSSQVFDCDPQTYLREQEQKSQLTIELNTLNMKLLRESKAFFDDLFQALIHLKIMRVFIDGVLRFGIPPKFSICIMKWEKNRDKKIRDALTREFAEEHLADVYGEKVDNQDEDYFPYILSEITCPEFLYK